MSMDLFQILRDNIVEQLQHKHGEKIPPETVASPKENDSRADRPRDEADQIVDSEDGEKSIIREILSLSAQTVREVIIGTGLTDSAVIPSETLGDITRDSQRDPEKEADHIVGSAPDSAEEEGEKSIIESVAEKLSLSARTVKEAVLGSSHIASSPIPADDMLGDIASDSQKEQDNAADAIVDNSTSDSTEVGGEKSNIQSLGEKIFQSAQTVKDAVLGNGHIASAPPPANASEAAIALDSRKQPDDETDHIVDSSPSVSAEEGEKSIIQSVGEIISHSAQTVKEVVLGDGHTTANPDIIDESGETLPMILVHSIVHD